jgi:scavenger receptor class B, member 1
MMPMLDMAIRAMTQIFEPKTAFLTARVMDILYDGVNVDCSSDDFGAVSFCAQLKDSRDFNVINDTSLTFSVFGGVS